MTLKIATGTIHPDGSETRGRVATFSSLEKFCEALNAGSAPSTGKQHSGPYWSPFAAPRQKGLAPAWQVLVLDYDSGAPDWSTFKPWAHVRYQTSSSTPEAPRWRVIVELEHSIPFVEVPRLVKRLFPGADTAALKPTQIFWHRHPEHRAEYFEGGPLEWGHYVVSLPPDPVPVQAAPSEPTMGRDALLEALYKLDPDFGYDDWLRIGMALHHEYNGSDEGFTEWLHWSERGTKFAGVGDLRSHWQSFKPGGGVTGLSLLAMQSAAIDDFPTVTQQAEPLPELLIGDAQIEPVELPPFLVDGLIEQNAEVLIYGAQGTFKSLFAIELGICVATGRSFFGRESMRGLVVYLAGEGAGGVRRRVRALKLVRELPSIGAFVIYDGKRVRFENEDGRKRLREMIEQLEQRTGEKLRLLIIDTYSRYAPSFDSKRPADEQMYKWLEYVAAVRHDASVLVVHHTGHDGGHARGTSAWNQATDTVFRTEGAGDEPRTFINEKQKDGQLAAPMHFQKVQVDTGYTRRRLDDSVMPVFSVALEATVIEVQQFGEYGQAAYEALKRLGATNKDAWITETAKSLSRGDMSKRDRRTQNAKRGADEVIEKGVAVEQAGMWRIVGTLIEDFDELDSLLGVTDGN